MHETPSRPSEDGVRMVTQRKVVNLCEYRKSRGIRCKHCDKKYVDMTAEDFLNKMRDSDSPAFDRPEGYDEE